MKIDVFAHMLPPRYLQERNAARMPASPASTRKYAAANRGLTDLALRFAIMDKFPMSGRSSRSPGRTSRASRRRPMRPTVRVIANDELATLVAAHPDRFIGACACLPMTDVDAALAEAERAIDTLGFIGVEVFTDIAGKPLD